MQNLLNLCYAQNSKLPTENNKSGTFKCTDKECKIYKTYVNLLNLLSLSFFQFIGLG